MTRGLEARGRAAVGGDEAHGAQDRGGLPALRDRLRGGPRCRRHALGRAPRES